MRTPPNQKGDKPEPESSGETTERSLTSAKRLATFDVPKGAAMIPASRIQEIIDEEGYF